MLFQACIAFIRPLTWIYFSHQGVLVNQSGKSRLEVAVQQILECFVDIFSPLLLFC